MGWNKSQEISYMINCYTIVQYVAIIFFVVIRVWIVPKWVFKLLFCQETSTLTILINIADKVDKCNIGKTDYELKVWYKMT